MNGLHENIAQYTHSGSKPCNMAASGEFVLGISFEYRGNSNKAKGALRLIWCSRRKALAGIWKHWHPQGNAKRCGEETRRLGGKAKMRWRFTARTLRLPPFRHGSSAAECAVSDYEARLVKMDFAWAAENRERILAEDQALRLQDGEALAASFSPAVDRALHGASALWSAMRQWPHNRQ